MTTFIIIIIFYFRFLVFAQNRPQNWMMTMFWSGEKARKKSLFLILGYFIWGFRLSQATVLMKSKLMATSLTNSPAKFLRKKKMHEWRNDAIPAENKKLKSAKTTEKTIFTSNKNKKRQFPGSKSSTIYFTENSFKTIRNFRKKKTWTCGPLGQPLNP